ncbi:NADPH:quinone oxidoreductase family protein [Rhodobacteraceae bacterium NNCM2]|nr:NADPH:quinone oxidoreductase family protein [Coraliihabitans acroporae]
MRAILCHAFGDPDQVAPGETAAPEPGPGEIVLDVAAAAVSYMDCLMAAGRYQMRPELPYVPGTDAAGVVTAVGEGVTRFKPGDRVAVTTWHGAFAEKMVAPAGACCHVRAGVSDAAAATVLQNYGTAYYALIVRAKLQPGETLFVTGAAGGVGLATMDLARKIGARIIAGVGSDAKTAIVREYGAEEVVNYATEDLRARLKELTGGKGVDVCMEMLGGETFLTMGRLMNWGGRLMPIGFTSGTIPELPMNLPLVKGYDVLGIFVGAWWERFRDQAIAANEQVMAWVAEGALSPRIDRILPLDEAREAMRLVWEREAQGRVVLKVGGD